MPFYRLYPIGRDNKISGPPTIVRVATDNEALSYEGEGSHGETIEVWRGATMIGVIPDT